MSDDNEQLIRDMHAAISRGEIEALEEAIADGVVEHEEIPGMEPTKEGVIQFFTYMRNTFPDLDFFRIENGRVAEHWGVTDTGVMMEQLGADAGAE